MLTFEELAALNKNRNICQIGILCKNIEETMKTMVEEFQIGPWIICDIDDTNTKDKTLLTAYCEEKFKMRVGVCDLGNIQLEVIQPFYGLPIYQKQLEAGVGYIHHIKEGLTEETFDKTLKNYNDKNLSTILAANFYNSRFAYLETINKIGFYMELGNCLPADFPEGSCWYYPERTK